MPHDPRRQYAASATARNKKVLWVDEAFVKQRVDACHQIVVILTRIGVHNLIAEGTSIARATTWVRTEDDVTLRRLPLPAVIEANTIHSMRSSVDVELHRVASTCIEVGWRDVPPLNL